MKTKQLLLPLLLRTLQQTFIQLLVAGLFAGLSLADGVRVQDVLNRGVSIQRESVEVRKVLNELEKQADVRFVYSSSAIPSRQLVTVRATNEKLIDVLNTLLTPLHITYEVVGTRILLRRTNPDRTSIQASDP